MFLGDSHKYSDVQNRLLNEVARIFLIARKLLELLDEFEDRLAVFGRFDF